MARLRASEYGGVEGLVQPEPHDIADSPYEQHRLMMATEPTDAGDTAEAVRVREAGKRGIAPRNTVADL